MRFLFIVDICNCFLLSLFLCAFFLCVRSLFARPLWLLALFVLAFFGLYILDCFVVSVCCLHFFLFSLVFCFVSFCSFSLVFGFWVCIVRFPTSLCDSHDFFFFFNVYLFLLSFLSMSSNSQTDFSRSASCNT